MDDERKILWMLVFAAKTARGEITNDCAFFADKAVECYEARFSVDLDEPSNDEA